MITSYVFILNLQFIHIYVHFINCVVSLILSHGKIRSFFNDFILYVWVFHLHIGLCIVCA